MKLSPKPQLFLTVSVLLMILFASAKALHAQKLRVAYTASAGTFTILWVGKEAGLYKKHGLDMERLVISSSTTAVNAPLAGDTDIVYSAAGAVVDANLAGGDLMMVGCQYDTGQTSFFTTAPITSITALKGKAVGVSRFGAFSDFVARHVLKKNGLQPIKDDNETLDATYKENVKDYALRVPYVSLTGLTSIIDFRAEGSAAVKKLALEKMFDNSLLQEIQKEQLGK